MSSLEKNEAAPSARATFVAGPVLSTRSNLFRGRSHVHQNSALESRQNGESSIVANGPDPKAYDLLEAKDGTWYFNLTAANNAKASAIGIKSVESNGTEASQWDVFEAINGEYAIRLVASNGQTIAGGELYTTKESAESAVTTISGLLVIFLNDRV